MERSLGPALRLPARTILALLAGLALLLTGPSVTAGSAGSTSGSAVATSITKAASAVTSPAAMATDLESHAARPPHLQRTVLVRYAGPRGWPVLAISAGGLSAPTAALLELAGTRERVDRTLLSSIVRGRGPPQPAGT